MLESAIKPSNYKGPNLEFIIRNPKESNEESLEKLVKLIVDKNETVKIGKFIEEQGCGNLIDEWKKTVEVYQSKLEFKDCSQLVDEILAVKETEELDNIKIASKYACFIMDNMIKKFENIIDDDKKITHEQISNEIKNLTEKPQFQIKFKEKYSLNNINTSQLEVSSIPVIQSGGKYNLQVFCQNDSSFLSSDIIICKVNTRYKDYNANIIRSFMIDADKPQQNHYKILFEAFNFLISQLVEGNKLNHVYDQVKDFIINKDKNLKDKLPDNFGYGIGLETNNLSLIINSENNKKLQTGMTFNIILSLVGLKTEKGFVYSLQFADIVCLKSPTSKENYTNDVSKSLTDIYYNMEDEEEEAKENEKMVVDSGGIYF
jgi:nucleosome binding factor SPN SPT16 subunit